MLRIGKKETFSRTRRRRGSGGRAVGPGGGPSLGASHSWVPKGRCCRQRRRLGASRKCQCRAPHPRPREPPPSGAGCPCNGSGTVRASTRRAHLGGRGPWSRRGLLAWLPPWVKTKEARLQARGHETSSSASRSSRTEGWASPPGGCSAVSVHFPQGRDVHPWTRLRPLINRWTVCGNDSLFPRVSKKTCKPRKKNRHPKTMEGVFASHVLVPG